MSNKPYPEGVTQVLTMVSRMRELEPQILELRAAYVKLKESEAEYDKLEDDLQKYLREMDLEEKGNYGWAGRFSWFLREFHRQINLK